MWKNGAADAFFCAHDKTIERISKFSGKYKDSNVRVDISISIVQKVLGSDYGK
jgi:hypothetical protein